ncbi:MAG: (2Fe-2S) ferredoxin domain-containing protein, partial [Chloroflexi bacterium]|nr:(2Fe-2S) ferredoxin domain-containing protein [Chloroflexota bacterium]
MQKHRTIFVCQETPCLSMGSDAVYEKLKAEVARQEIVNVTVEISGCHGHGLCEQGPSIVVEPEGIFYLNVKPEDAPEIVSSHLRDGRPVERLLYR